MGVTDETDATVETDRSVWRARLHSPGETGVIGVPASVTRAPCAATVVTPIPLVVPIHSPFSAGGPTAARRGE